MNKGATYIGIEYLGKQLNKHSQGLFHNIPSIGKEKFIEI